MTFVSISDEDFNDRCDALLDKLYQTYHTIHYNMEGPIDIARFQSRYEERKRRKEIRFKQLQLYRKRQYRGRQ